MSTYYCVTTSCDDRGRVKAAITGSKEASAKPKSTFKSTRTKDIYIDWFSSLEDAWGYVVEAKEA